MSPHDDGINGNPVGDLQEMCMNRRLPPPVYEVGLEKGAPHERCFIIVCAVGGNLKESGSGKSKKLAKRQAAHKMLNTLKSMPVERDNEQSFAMIDEDDLAQGKLLCFFIIFPTIALGTCTKVRELLMALLALRCSRQIANGSHDFYLFNFAAFCKFSLGKKGVILL